MKACVNVTLTDEQVSRVVYEYIATCSADERRNLALQVFVRREDLDPTVSLAYVVRQVCRQHALSIACVLDDVKRILKKRA